MQHAPFLLALAADPLNDINRLVYADWLEEQGHPLAELLRLQVSIRELHENDPDIESLAKRESVILHASECKWNALDEALEKQPKARVALEERVLGISRRHPVCFDCPSCHATSAYRMDARNPMVLHWIANPGLAFNELVLGQRIPKVMLFCRECWTCSVRCVACRRLLTLQQLYGERVVGMWVRLPCSGCGSDIPLVRNWLAKLIIGVGKRALRSLRATKGV
jgi:uncharacterized protein (TIGR02996 family)